MKIGSVTIDSRLSLGPMAGVTDASFREICREQGIPCEVSLEKRMACGLGACLSCNIDSTGGRRLHVCQDGPVFRGEEVFA